MERLPGFRDFYPEPLPHTDVWSADTRQWLFGRWREVARRYGFREYDGPPLEPLELYTAKSGAEIVGQLYHFSDKGSREVALRPEMTPTLARMVAAQERRYKKPIRWFSIPQLFRYERQQKGRLREHFQLNADLFGESDPAADAEVIALLVDALRACGLGPDDFVVRLSSRKAWHDFFTARCADPARAEAFYPIIDKLEREPEALSAQRLRELGFELEDVRRFIAEGQPDEELGAICHHLRGRGLEPFIKIDYGIIRGLAYYTGVVFEAFDRRGEFRALAGGGRYDHLIRTLSGGKVDLPGLGFGMGDVVLTELLRQRGRLPQPAALTEIFCLIDEESLRPATLGLVQSLRDSGFAVEYALTPMKPDKQLRRALELGASFAVRWAPEGAPACRIKHLKTRQEFSALAQELPDLLRRWPQSKAANL